MRKLTAEERIWLERGFALGDWLCRLTRRYRGYTTRPSAPAPCEPTGNITYRGHSVAEPIVPSNPRKSCEGRG